jgi:hypothetical protein
VLSVETGVGLWKWEISATDRATFTFVGNTDVNSFNEF